jgi:hypothetical protein
MHKAMHNPMTACLIGVGQVYMGGNNWATRTAGRLMSVERGIAPSLLRRSPDQPAPTYGKINKPFLMSSKLFILYSSYQKIVKMCVNSA